MNELDVAIEIISGCVIGVSLVILIKSIIYLFTEFQIGTDAQYSSTKCKYADSIDFLIEQIDRIL